VTADQVGTFLSSGNQLNATNCIFTAVTNLSGSAFSDCINYASGAGIYQTVGAGAYYLTQGSTNQSAGTTNIDTNLLADLETKTTCPPVTNFVGWLTNDYTFFPQAQRDNSGAAVDLGYHYDPLDYVVSTSISNATATVLPGTALATAGRNNCGIWLYSAANINCIGTATSPNYIVRYNTVQEVSNTNLETYHWRGSCDLTPSDGTSVSADFRFTEWSVLGGDSQFSAPTPTGSEPPIVFQDCQFYNGIANAVDCTIVSSNCLWQRIGLSLTSSANNVSNAFCNNLFLEGELYYQNANGSPNAFWSMLDNLFNQTAITKYATYSGDICSHNAYVTTSFGVLSPNNSPVVLTASPIFQVGTLGNYYYPTSETQLINAGSRSAAAAGLYHYTVLKNNTIEGNNTVSIGFHYVACSNGIPISTPGDGIPDYIADINGNGLVDPGEISWTNYMSSNGLTAASGLVVFTPMQ
jgi:hypothetical protein